MKKKDNKMCNATDSMTEQFRSVLDAKMRGLEWPYMSPENYQKAIENGKNIALIDVRKSLDCCYVGLQHPSVDLYNVPLNEFASGICDVPLSKYQTIVCICVGGPKSSVAATILRMLGYDNAYFLGGGIKGLVSISALDNQGDV